jgi:hypothetical protein
MSTVRAKIDAFVSYSGGEVRLSNDDWPDDHPVVVERPAAERRLVTDTEFRFVPGEQEVSWRVIDPDGNVVQEGYGQIELQMVTRMGEDSDGSDRPGDGQQDSELDD